MRHSPEQQLPPELHVSPSVEQLPLSSEHVPALHSLLQHCVFEVQVPPPTVQAEAVEHVSERGSQ